REVIVRSQLAWAGRVVRTLGRTAHGPVVGAGDLFHPANRAGLQIHGHDGIRAGLRRIGVAVAGADIQQTAANVDCRRRPDAAARRTVELHSGGVFAAWLRLRDGVGLPQDVAVFHIQGHHAAPESTAGIVVGGADAFLAYAL